MGNLRGVNLASICCKLHIGIPRVHGPWVPGGPPWALGSLVPSLGSLRAHWCWAPLLRTLGSNVFQENTCLLRFSSFWLFWHSPFGNCSCTRSAERASSALTGTCVRIAIDRLVRLTAQTKKHDDSSITISDSVKSDLDGKLRLHARSRSTALRVIWGLQQGQIKVNRLQHAVKANAEFPNLVAAICRLRWDFCWGMGIAGVLVYRVGVSSGRRVWPRHIVEKTQSS